MDNPRAPFIGRPLFWILLIGGLWTIPLIKSLGAEFPDPVPGFDSEPIAFAGVDDLGRAVTQAELAGHLIVVSELAFAEDITRELEFDRLRRLRKRLRGLGSTVVYVTWVKGGSTADVRAFVEDKKARKPSSIYFVDEAGDEMRGLRLAIDRADAEFVLLDRHARVRGAYADVEAEIDRLALDAGMLANWRGSDPEPGQPVGR